MSFTRFISFLLIVIIFGLFQVWISVIDNWNFDINRALGNGGLFFFSTSLVVSSSIELHDEKGLKIGNRDFLFGLITGVPVFAISLVTYTRGISDELIKAQTFIETPQQQSVVVLLSIVYWIYVGFRTGKFKQKRERTSYSGFSRPWN